MRRLWVLLLRSFLNEYNGRRNGQIFEFGPTSSRSGYTCACQICSLFVNEFLYEPNHSIVVAVRGYAESTPSFLGKDNKPE